MPRTYIATVEVTDSRGGTPVYGSQDPTELWPYINRTAMRGAIESWLCSFNAKVTELVLKEDGPAQIPYDKIKGAYPAMRPRDIEACLLVVAGKSNLQIAAALSIGVQSVKNRVGRACKVTNSANRTELAVQISNLIGSHC